MLAIAGKENASLRSCLEAAEKRAEKAEGERDNLRAFIKKLEHAAYRAIDHVATANYPEREREARQWIENALLDTPAPEVPQKKTLIECWKCNGTGYDAKKGDGCDVCGATGYFSFYAPEVSSGTLQDILNDGKIP